MIQAFRNHLANRNIESRFINDELSILALYITYLVTTVNLTRHIYES